jgi:hypothetical protein
MILQHITGLNTKRIVLASGSPRRKELLGNLGLKFEVTQRQLMRLVHAGCMLLHATCS